MYESYSVGIKEQIGQEEIETLTPHIEDLLNCTQEDFQNIINEKWYTRLWEIVTFSKNNEKFIAKKVSDLAKAQDVALKLIVDLYQKNLLTNRAISGLSDRLDITFDINISIMKKLKEMKEFARYGKKPISPSTFSDYEGMLFLSSVVSIMNEYPSAEYIADFRAAMQKLFKQTSIDSQYVPENFENLDSEKAALLYEYYIVLNYICTKTFEFCEKIEEIIRCLCISSAKKKLIEDKTKIDIVTMGIKRLVDIYGSIETDLTVMDDGIELSLIGADNENNENDEIDVSIENETDMEYWGLQDFLFRSFSQNSVYFFDENDKLQFNNVIYEKANKFINKNKLLISNETTLVFFDTTFWGGAKEGILLTTWGLYYKDSLSEEVKYVAYADMCNITTVLNPNSERCVKINGNIQIPETSVAKNFAETLRYIYEETQKDSTVVAYNDVIYDMKEMDTDYKVGYIKTLAMIIYEKLNSISIEQRAAKTYLMCRACDIDIPIERVDTIFDNSVENESMKTLHLRLKYDCPYPMYTEVLRQLVVDLYRINYMVNKNQIYSDFENLLGYLKEECRAEIDINTDLILYDLRIQDDSLTDEQMTRISNYGTELLGNLGIGAAAGFLITNPWLAVAVGVAGSMGNVFFSQTNLQKNKNNERIRVLKQLKDNYEHAKLKIKKGEAYQELYCYIENISKLIVKYENSL